MTWGKRYCANPQFGLSSAALSDLRRSLRLFLWNAEHGMHRLNAAIACLAALFAAGPYAQGEPKPGLAPNSAPKRINIENLITAEPLPDHYEIERRDIRQADRLLGHKLTLTREGAVSKAIVSVDRQFVATRAEKVTTAKAYIYEIVQSFRAAGLKPVEKELPDIDEHDFRKRVTANLVYKDPADKRRLQVQIQIFFTDRGHTVLVVSDDEEDHELLTRWARSVRGTGRW
jgi:hypothetical protein